MDVMGAASTFISQLLTKKSKGYQDGLSAFGDFDVDQFVNGNLDRAKNTPGTELNQVTAGIADLLGFGPKKQIGIDQPAQPIRGPGVGPSPSMVRPAAGVSVRPFRGPQM